MTEFRLSRTLTWSAFALLATTLAITGYWLLFTTFMIYDDEGYVLISLKNFSLTGGLYDQIFTQYGPFPYLLYDALHRVIGFDFTNTAGRWITLVNWLGSAAICAALVGRTTRSFLWAAVTMAGTFVYLWIMVHEPVHPGGLITMIVASATWAGAEAWGNERFGRFAVVTALASAALVMTKINVGAFFLGATLCWLALNTKPTRAASALAWIAALGCAALPFGLMQALFDAPWVRLFALVFTGAALGLLLVGSVVGRPVVTRGVWIQFSIVLVAGIGVLLGLTMARGSSFHGMLKGILFDPLKHPGVYFFAMRWRTGTGILSLASLVFVGWTAWKGRWQDPRLCEFIAWVRVACALAFTFTSFGMGTTSFPAFGLCFGLSLSWMFALPLHPQSSGGSVRTWVALVLVFQSLHAYPVAGSQLSWGTFLWVPLLVLGLHDAAPILQARLARLTPWPGRIAVATVILITCFIAQHLAGIGWAQYKRGQPLGLKGAENFRLPNEDTYALRIAHENICAHADLLFSLPGIYSANLWTGLPTPTLANATHWFSLLPSAEQQKIIDRLETSSRAILLVQRDLLDYLNKHGFHPQGLLHSWLLQHFTKALAVGGYEIWIRSGRSIAPLSIATATRDSNRMVDAFTFIFRAPKAPVARVDLCNLDRPDSPLFSFGPENAAVNITACNLDGAPLGQPAAVKFPFNFPELAKVTLNGPPLAVYGPVDRLLLVLRDAHGSVVHEILVVE